MAGDRLVPLATATASPAAMPAALETQPSRASLRHTGRRRGHKSPMVMSSAYERGLGTNWEFAELCF